MNTLNKVLMLCKVTNCSLHEDEYGRFTIYTWYDKVVVANTNLSEALHYIRLYLKTRRIMEDTFTHVVE